MSKPRDERQKDLFRPALERIIDMGHPLVRLAEEIDWGFLERRFASVCATGPGQPPLPARLIAGLFVLKHMHSLSDEVLCARWVENPYYQYFCGEQFFRHELPFDRSSMTRWRQRLGEEHLAALLQESLSVAHKTGAVETKDLERVVVDSTVQPKAVAHPTDARLMYRAIEKLVALAKRHGVPLRQSYIRVAKQASIMVGRYSHAHQFKRARRMLRFLRTRLGRLIRDIGRKIEGDGELEALFIPLLGLASRRTGTSVARRSMPCMPRRSSASARARPALLTSLAARSASPRPSPHPRVASSSSTPRRCTEAPMTAIPSAPSLPIWRSSLASRPAASTSTRGIAATITRTGSGSGSPARSAGSPPRSAAR